MWQGGGTGRGVDIAILDTGINPNLPEFANKVHPASRDIVAQRGLADTEGHGTAVAAVAAAARDGSRTLGVAFDSRVLSLNTSDPANCDPEDGCRHPESAIATAVDVARANGARVVNISLGGEGVGQALIAAVQRATAAGLVVVIAAGNESAANPTAFASQLALAGGGNVIIAGSSGVSAGPGTVDLSQISAFSNRAGSSAPSYLAALGFRVVAPDETGTLFQWSGTSFSAPVISGAAALLASAFPNLTGGQIAELLLSSADDVGEPGVDAVFGRGLLNLNRAFAPRGALHPAGTGGAPVSAIANGTTSTPMGDARPTLPGMVVLDGFNRAYAIDLARTLTRAPAEQPLAEALQPGLESGGMTIGASSVAVAVTVRRSLAGRSDAELARIGLSRADAERARVVAAHALTRLSPRTAVALGFSESARMLQQRLAERGGGAFLVARDPALRTGFIAEGARSAGIRHDLGPVALTVTAETGEVGIVETLPVERRPGGYSQTSVTVDRRLGPVDLSLGVTRLQEQASLLGARFGFAPEGAVTTFLDAGLGYAFGGGWGGQARLRAGWTLLPQNGGLVRGGTLGSDAWSLDLWRAAAFRSGDVLSLRVSQPLRVREGGYLLNLPTSYNYDDGRVGYTLSPFNLAPRGREIDLEAAYRVPLWGEAGSLSAHGFLRRQPGHYEAAGDDLGVAVRLALGF